MTKNPMMGRRAFVGGTLATSALATLAACGKKSAPDAGSASGTEEGGTIYFYINNPACIDPYDTQESEGTQVEFELFDALTLYDFEKKELVGLAAESWEPNDDATQFTFHLKSGAKFHNGETVTSASFKYGFERICNPDTNPGSPSNISYHLAYVKGYDEMLDGSATELSGVTCPDDDTLVIELTSAFADFPYVCSHPALAPIPEAAKDDFQTFYLAPIGNGPFKMNGKWEDGQEIILDRFDDYYGEKAKLSSIVFSIQKDMETAYKEFQAGNLDVCDVPVAQIDSAIEDRGESEDGYTMSEGHHMLLGEEMSTYYLIINNTVEPFNNAEFRRALSLAINREAICDTLFKGTRKPADGIVPPAVAGYEEQAWADCRYDVDAATELLDKLYPADSDGSRGLKLTLSYNQDGGHKEIMESIIGDLAKVGIEVTSDTPEWAAYIDELDAKNYQFGRMGWSADYPILDNFLFPMFNSASSDNKTGYNDPEVDAALTAARAIVDDDERIAALQKINRTVGDAMPIIPLMFYAHQICGSDNVKTLYVDPSKRADLSTAEIA